MVHEILKGKKLPLFSSMVPKTQLFDGTGRSTGKYTCVAPEDAKIPQRFSMGIFHYFSPCLTNLTRQSHCLVLE
jgi:hypothetical protein